METSYVEFMTNFMKHVYALQIYRHNYAVYTAALQKLAAFRASVAPDDEGIQFEAGVLDDVTSRMFELR